MLSGEYVVVLHNSVTRQVARCKGRDHWAGEAPLEVPGMSGNG